LKFPAHQIELSPRFGNLRVISDGSHPATTRSEIAVAFLA
jgi:hypothetical protein